MSTRNSASHDGNELQSEYIRQRTWVRDALQDRMRWDRRDILSSGDLGCIEDVWAPAG